MDIDVGDRLREVRERRGMKQSELAAKLGVHVMTVTLWENRKNRRKIAPSIYRRSRKSLNIRVSELLGEEGAGTDNTRSTAHHDPDSPRFSCCGCSG